MEEDRKIQIKNFMNEGFDIEIGDEYIDMYDEALTHHNDYAPKGTREIERLAFLGDAYLELIVREHLFWHKDYFSIGIMTHMKKSIVSNDAWAEIAEKIKLNEQIVTMQHGSRIENTIYSPKVLARSFEALAITIYHYSNGYNPNEKLIDFFIKLGYLPSREDNQN